MFVITSPNVFIKDRFTPAAVFVRDGLVADIFPISEFPRIPGVAVLDFNNACVVPGLTDVHVHLREPGFSYKETIKTGTKAAARGGYTTVCAMPNLNPVPDSIDTLKIELDVIARDAQIRVVPYGSITAGEAGEKLAGLEAMADRVAGFSDDGRGVQNGSVMESAMYKAKQLGKIITAHCEDNSCLKKGGCVHEGYYAASHGLVGIPSESEWRQVERDIALLRKTGCSYHVCHVSAKESVALIRRAKADGLDITCETAPHYLVLSDLQLRDDGAFKMNPPIRSDDDRDALIAGIKDGTIDMIATDHAPHSAEEKSGGLKGSMMGIVGLETAFPVLYTELVLKNIISLEKLIDLMSVKPAARFGIPSGIEAGMPADISVFELNERFTIDPAEFSSQGKATPFAGKPVTGRCKMTIAAGKIVYQE